MKRVSYCLTPKNSVSTCRGLRGMLLLCHFSRIWLCATPWTAAHQAPSSLGFSRQEHWSGLPFPSPMHESEKWKWSRSVVSDSLRPHGLQPTRLLHPWDFPGKSTRVGCHCLLWIGGWDGIKLRKHFGLLGKEALLKWAGDFITLQCLTISGLIIGQCKQPVPDPHSGDRKPPGGIQNLLQEIGQGGP